MFGPTDKYPEYCFTALFASQSPALDTYSSVDPVSACSKIVTVAPFLLNIRVVDPAGFSFLNNSWSEVASVMPTRARKL